MSGTIGERRAVQLMKAGAHDYIDKTRPGRLLPVVRRELAEARERQARRSAERALREREQQAVLELAAAYEATLEGWARALDLRDRETEGHSRRVTALALQLARRMGVSEEDCVHLRRGALLHDIGKMGIPDSILLKAAALDAEERQVMRRHPEYARELLGGIEFLRAALDIPYSHHEWWDGSGYPRGLRGEEIPLAARIFAVVDVWDALRSNRPYRRAWPAEDARHHLQVLAGSHLDPAVVRAFFEMLDSLDPEALDAAVEAPGSRLGERILVVEDFRANAVLIARWLEAAGYDVVTADSGTSALEAVASHRPALVLLDAVIPPPDGFVVCRRLKSDPATAAIPVILMSGLEPSEAETKARHVAADDYLVKPVDGYELRGRVRDALDRARGRMGCRSGERRPSASRDFDVPIG
jgi:putative nucleotidyltransferase with HDIG domain